MPVPHAIGQISHDPGEEQSERDIAQGVARVLAEEKRDDKDERAERERDEEGVVVLEGTEGRPVVRDKNEREKLGHNDARRFRREMADCQPLRHLIESVKRQRKKEDKSHLTF